MYHIIGRCTAHDRIPLKDKNICYMCKQKSSPDNSTKIYTRKELVMKNNKNLRFSYQFLHTIHPKVSLSYTICAHTWYKPMWLNATHRLQTT